MIHKKIIFAFFLLFSSEQLHSMSLINKIPERHWDYIALFSMTALRSITAIFISEFLIHIACVENWPSIIRLYNHSHYLGKFLTLFRFRPDSDLVFTATVSGSEKVVAELLKYPNIDVNCDDGLPLLRAIITKNINIVQLFLQHPTIDLNKKRYLSYVSNTQNVEILRQLINHPKILFKKKDVFNSAICSDWLDGIKLLTGYLPPHKEEYEDFLRMAIVCDSIKTFDYFTHLSTFKTKHEESSFRVAVYMGSINIIGWLRANQKITDEQLLEKLHVTPCEGKNYNKRSQAGLRLLDITREWYLSTIYNDSNKLNANKKKEVYYKLLKATPAWSCQTIYEALLKKYPSKDVAGNIMGSYLTVMIPKLPLDTLKQKIHALNKIQSTPLLTTQ